VAAVDTSLHPPDERAAHRRARATDARRGWAALAVALALLVVAVATALAVGVVRLSPGQVLGAVFARSDPANFEASAVIWSLRLPRALVAVLVGAGLAAVGTVMQALLRNPLADPGVTGVSAGAAVGAVAGIVLGFAGSLSWGVPLAAFAGAAAVALLLQAVLQSRRDLGAPSVILVGVSLNALAGAAISVLIANAHDDALARGAMFWLAGDLELRDWHHVLLVVGPVLAGLAVLLTRARTLDALALGEEVAATSGVDVHRERILLLLVCSLVTGAAVAVSGIISFVGLVVPHALRLVVGGAHQRLLPLSAVAGGLFLLLADTVARTAFSPVVVQTGVVCALVGAPVFLALLLRRTSR
jgi:iron complex transport system permease protein